MRLSQLPKQQKRPPSHPSTEGQQHAVPHFFTPKIAQEEPVPVSPCHPHPQTPAFARRLRAGVKFLLLDLPLSRLLRAIYVIIAFRICLDTIAALGKE
jgi:hypothetical protein